MTQKCLTCGREFEAKKSAKTCSAACRVTLFRQREQIEVSVRDVRRVCERVDSAAMRGRISDEELIAYVDYIERELARMKYSRPYRAALTRLKSNQQDA